jgi:hypothetical protein
MVYFYLIDKQTLMPSLEGAMNNYFSCNQMIIGKAKRYCLTFKANQKNFFITRRKYNHDFMVQLNKENLEKQCGLELEKNNAFIISQTNKVTIYNSQTFAPASTLPISLIDSNSREPSQVLELQKSEDEVFVGAVSGKNLIKDRKQINQLWIFTLGKPEGESSDSDDTIDYRLYKNIKVFDKPEFKGVASEFQFTSDSKPGNVSLIFIRSDKIFKIDVDTEVITDIMVFPEPISESIIEILPNTNQTKFLVNAFTDCYFIDSVKGIVINLC